MDTSQFSPDAAAAMPAPAPPAPPPPEADPWAAFNPQAAPAQAAADPWAAFNPQTPEAPKTSASRTLSLLGDEGGVASPIEAPSEKAKSAVGTAVKVGAKGVPVAGAYVPQTPDMTEFEEKDPMGASIAKGLGGVAATIPIALAAPELMGVGGAMWARAPTAFASQAGLSYADALARGDKQPGETAVGSGAMAAGATAGEGLIRPFLNPDIAANVRRLDAAGVRMDLGQILGGHARSLGNKATSLPLIGENLKEGLDQSSHDFMRNRLNTAMGRIGQTFPENMAVDREGIEHVSDAISQQYHQHIPNMRADLDQPFNNDLEAIMSRAAGPRGPIVVGQPVRRIGGELPEPQVRELERIVDTHIVGPFNTAMNATGGAVIPGEMAKGIDTYLGQTARGLQKNPNHYDQQLGTHVRDLQEAFRDLMVRNSPADASEGLQAANRAHAEYVPIRDAAIKPGATYGGFTPNQYEAAVKKNTVSKEQYATATGNADRVERQQFAEDAKDVLPNKVPDSGTAGRSSLIDLAAAVVAGHQVHPMAVAAALGAYGTTSAAGRSIGRNLILRAPEFRQSLSDALRIGAPLAGGQYGRQNPDQAKALSRALEGMVR